VLATAKNKTDAVSCWATKLQERRGYWKAVIAMAAKNTRMAWALLARVKPCRHSFSSPRHNVKIRGVLQTAKPTVAGPLDRKVRRPTDKGK
jgi:hypothetical protein